MSAQDPEGGGFWNNLRSFFGMSSTEKPAQQHIDDGSTLLDKIVIGTKSRNWFQRNFSSDKLSNDFKNIKENAGINHFKKESKKLMITFKTLEDLSFMVNPVIIWEDMI